MGHLETLEGPAYLGLAELLGEHAGEAGPVEELVLEGEVAEQCLVEVLALLDRSLERGADSADGNTEHVRNMAEAADGVGKQTGTLCALAGILVELALDIGCRCLGPASLGDHLFSLGEPQQGVELCDEELST